MGYSGTSYLYPNKALYPLFPWTAENDTSITVTGTPVSYTHLGLM